MIRTWLVLSLFLLGCKPEVDRASGSSIAGAGVGYSQGSGGTGGEGGAGGNGGDGGAGAQGGASSCRTDADCQMSAEWCDGGSCVACDNSASMCDIACPDGWSLYQRNGCHPCACAPPNECLTNDDCGAGATQCYTGNFCWDWCPPGDPSCCFGNTCDLAGCGDTPTGCFVTGCPQGQECVESGCTSMLCQCDGAMWICGSDCLGGMCM